jgi:hypothetical protein
LRGERSQRPRVDLGVDGRTEPVQSETTTGEQAIPR